MRCFVLGLLLFATLLPAADEKGKSEKEPEVFVEEIEVRREGRRILIDGVVVANREKPIRGLKVKFDLLAPGDQLISWQEARVSKDTLEAGDDVTFYLQCADHARAVAIRIDVRTGGNMSLLADNNGPFPIE
ncbi:MAG: hypothetical protein GY953_37535 [bacterium]|nr:hypothetical protein [bacterium]